MRLVWPDMISTWVFDRPRLLARNLTHNLLAALSTGAAVSFILRASSCRPTIMFLAERGCTKILKVIPSGCSLIDSVLIEWMFELANSNEWILILNKELFRQDLQDFTGFYFNISSFLKKLEIYNPLSAEKIIY